MIINAGIREVVYQKRYALDDSARKILKEAKVKTRTLRV